MLRGLFDLTRGLMPVACLIVAGCASSSTNTDPASERVGRVRANLIAEARLAQDGPLPTTRPAETGSTPVQASSPPPVASVEELYAQIPGLVEGFTKAQSNLKAELAEIDDELKKIAEAQKKKPLDTTEADMLANKKRQLEARRAESLSRFEEVRARVAEIQRPKVVNLSLTDAIRRALEHNYYLQVQGYNPAIQTTRIVEAEANFDAVYFANFSNTKQDRPSSSELIGTQTQNRVFESGVRKLLSTGMQVSTSYNLTRAESNLVFQTLNPSYFNQFIVEFRQPLLRGFGLDFNRSQIELAKLDRAVSMEQLRREIREVLYNIEQAYWRLWEVRRRVVISARLLADLKKILHWLDQRMDAGHDVYPIQVNLTASRIEQREVAFVQERAAVKNAEDALKSLINDPDLNQATNIEIVPVDTPSTEAVMIDELGEITAALTHRSELHEAKLMIEQAQIGIGVAKNQALPRLDLMFRYIVDGLGSNADRAFSQLTENDFHEYVTALEFEWPIGNRGPEAVLRRARYQQAQAIAAHRAQIEQIITEVKKAIRDLQTAYEQVGPSYRAARASEAQLRAIQERQETRSPPNLEVELNAHEALAGAREALVRSLANYHLGLINLERQKGTLLHYNNVVIEGIEKAGHTERFRALGP
jgi:outer membrane protein TolC